MLKNKKKINKTYFKKLTQDLQQQGTAMPQLIVDVDALTQNIEQVVQMLARSKTFNSQQIQPRLVVKSLACIELLQFVVEQFQTHGLSCERFMVFHAVHLDAVLQAFPDADILLGKPMPAKVVTDFYAQFSQYQQSNIQWLVDSTARLQQYLEITKQHSKQYNLQLKVNIEIDVGLHRGGVTTDSEMRQLLQLIDANPQHLRFTGLMGYDAHVAKIPTILQSMDVSYQQSQTIYQNYQQLIKAEFPTLWQEDLCFNGAGSPTFALHCQQSVCNDLSFGSMLLKPSDFDLKTLQNFQSALWIATPVLKVLPFSQIPGFPMLDRLPHLKQAAFVYGGYWMADYHYPQGATPHALYGRSSNQEMVQIPKNSVAVDDYVFLRPHQSEALIPQFFMIYAYQAGQFQAWQTLRE
ncbi:alanine racemase [Acinetobacter sedimenti]|uniref:alanine racemase n=1 Tax=Acinetobacter sedimenti TaxID=2919922 RepID=UPI0038992168